MLGSVGVIGTPAQLLTTGSIGGIAKAKQATVAEPFVGTAGAGMVPGSVVTGADSALTVLGSALQEQRVLMV